MKVLFLILILLSGCSNSVEMEEKWTRLVSHAYTTGYMTGYIDNERGRECNSKWESIGLRGEENE